MTVTIDSTGISIQTFDEVIEEIVVAMQTALGLTAPQADRVRTSLQSTLGQLARIEAEREVLLQEAILAAAATLQLDTTGAHLDATAELLGVTRRAAFSSRIIGTAAGTASTVITDGTRIRYNPESTVWEVVGGPYTIGGGGTVAIQLKSQDSGSLTVAIDPDTGYDDWDILDVIAGFDTFESTTQSTVGATIETDATMRQRARTQAFARAQGTNRAIEAAVIAVEGVTYVRSYDNATDTGPDANGLPAHNVNVVVRGGATPDVAEAIFGSKPAGSPLYALAGGTKVTETVTDVYGIDHTIVYNTVEDVTIHIRATLTTSTSEEAAPTDLETLIKDLLLAQAEAIFDIGDDILPWRLAGAIHEAGIPGIDDVSISLSLDDASFSTAKRVMTIRQQGSFSLANIDVVED